MKLPTFLIDTFTPTPFKGNPTAVCQTNEELSYQTMLFVARELNCPVTAFIKIKAYGRNNYDIRYFTTTTEIPACGHATLASAKFLQEQNTGHNNLLFHATNNTVIKTVVEGTRIIMAYPVFSMEDCVINNKLMDSLHLQSYKAYGYTKELETLFIEVDPDTLRTLQPNYSALVRADDNIKEVVITSSSDEKHYDYLLRSFCPWIGIDEDPVTGSVHSVLANFWKGKLEKSNMNVYQASERGGELVVKAFDDKVEIGGEAVIVFKGEILLK
jgi:PhzF family phenazine biosynthesis protein